MFVAVWFGLSRIAQLHLIFHTDSSATFQRSGQQNCRNQYRCNPHIHYGQYTVTVPWFATTLARRSAMVYLLYPLWFMNSQMRSIQV